MDAKCHNRASFCHSVAKEFKEESSSLLTARICSEIEERQTDWKDYGTLNRAKRSKMSGWGSSWTVWHQSMKIITKGIEDIGSNEMGELWVIEMSRVWKEWI